MSKFKLDKLFQDSFDVAQEDARIESIRIFTPQSILEIQSKIYSWRRIQRSSFLHRSNRIKVFFFFFSENLRRAYTRYMYNRNYRLTASRRNLEPAKASSKVVIQRLWSDRWEYCFFFFSSFLVGRSSPAVRITTTGLVARGSWPKS